MPKEPAISVREETYEKIREAIAKSSHPEQPISGFVDRIIVEALDAAERDGSITGAGNMQAVKDGELPARCDCCGNRIPSVPRVQGDVLCAAYVAAGCTWRSADNTAHRGIACPLRIGPRT